MPHDIAVLKKLIRFLWPSQNTAIKRRTALAFALLALAKLASALTPILYKGAVDRLPIMGSSLDFTSLPFLMIIAYGLARIGSQAFNELKDAIFARVEQNAVHHAALAVFDHLHGLSLRFHLDRKTGGLTRVVERGIRGIETILRFMLFNIVPIFFEVIFVAIIMWVMFDAIYMVVTLVTLAVYIGATLWITGWRINFIKQMNTSDNDSTSKAVDSLLNYETVKYFGNEAFESKRYAKALEGYTEASVKSKQSLSLLNITQGIIIAVGLVALMGVAAFDVAKGTMTLGGFVLVNTYLIQLYLPLNILGFAYREIKLSLVNIEEVFSLMDILPEVQDTSVPQTFQRRGGSIEFKSVQFAYDPEKPILKDISFKVIAGKTLAIVGPSGAGKSTIARLLFRFYDVSGGSILIDGQDIRNVRQKELRHAIGVVPQDTILFNDTIYYNLAYGNPGASETDIYKAARLANIDTFIDSLPQKYQTIVGERGLKLSGGEKQRIAIARTLLKAPSIFIFDEATSALDTHTEKAIQHSIHQVSAAHTTVIIAHRLSTVVDVDEILVLQNGKVAEQGTHQDLMAQGGLYAALWNKQQSHL